jgi:hypothetical protein
MDQVVMAQGRAALAPNGATIHILHITELRQIATARARSLGALAQEQGIGPVESPAEFYGEPIDDFTEFMAIVQSARGDEL